MASNGTVPNLQRKWTVDWRQTLPGPNFHRTMASVISGQLEGHAPVSATVLTLGLYVKGLSAQDWVDLAVQISERHPARLIVIDPNSSSTVPQLTIHYHATAHGQAPPVLRSECVDLRLDGALASHWIDVIQPLIRSDLPSYLWWRASAPHEPFRWDLLRTEFSHIIVDTQQSWAPWSKGFIEARSEGLAMDDMEWYRLAPWRNLLASVADSQEGLWLLHNLSAMTFEGPNESFFVLFTGWLASQLEWTWQRVRSDQIVLRAPTTTIFVSWKPSSETHWQLDTENSHLTMSSMDSVVVAEWHDHDSKRIDRWAEPARLLDPLEPLYEILKQGHDPLFDECLDIVLESEEPL